MSKKFKRSLLTICSFALVCAVALGFGGCKKKNNSASEQASPAIVWTVEKAYAQAQSEGFTGTLEEFLQKLTTISKIKLDDLGRLIFTMNDGTVITAGTVGSGAPGRGIKSVRTEADRWGLVVTTIYTFTDDGESTHTYTTSPMYGREYDFVNTSELEYLVANDVKNLVLAEGIDYETANFTLNLAKSVNINLNKNTISANKFKLTGEGNISVTLRNGTLKTVEGVEISVPNGDLTFEDFTALDENGVVDLNASTTSLYVKGDVSFLKGIDDGIAELEPAKVNIPANTRIVIEEDANLNIESIEVVEVEGFEGQLTVILNSDIDVKVNGDALVSGEYMENVEANNVTNATVQIGSQVYANLTEAMEDFREGSVINVIANTTWTLTNDVFFDYRFAVYFNGNKVNYNGENEDLTFLTHIVGMNDHYVQVNKDGDTLLSVKVLKCEDHVYPEGEGYCSVCGHEGDFPFVVKVDGKKYLTFEEVYNKLNTEAEFELLAKVEWSSESPITIDYTFEIANPFGYGFEILTPETIKLADSFYWANETTKIAVAQCTNHADNYEYGYCTVCGHEDTEGDYAVKVGDKKYASIDAVIADGAFKNRVVIDLLKNTTWNIDEPKNIDYSVTIRFNNFTLDGTYKDEGKIVIPVGVYRNTAEEQTIEGGAFVITRCDAHDFGGVEDTDYGYCPKCGMEDIEADFALEVVGGRKYSSFDTLIADGQLKDGVVINLLKGTTWSIYSDSPIAVDFEFTVNKNGKSLIINDVGDIGVDNLENKDLTGYLTFVNPYYSVSDSNVYKSVRCGGSVAHEFYESRDRYVGYCIRCGQEDENTTAVAEVKSAKRKFASFDELIQQGFIYENVVVDLIAKTGEGAITTIEYDFSNVTIDNAIVFNKNGMTFSENTLASIKTSAAFELVETDTQYIITCVEHNYGEGDTCLVCGSEKPVAPDAE